MQDPDFEKIYRTLGVEQGASWEEIQKAYRRKAQAAHPDRARGNPRIEKIAQAKFDEIKTAYDELKRYKRIFGSLPTDAVALKTPRDGSKVPEPPPHTPPDSHHAPIDPLDSPAVPTPPRRQYRRRWLTAIGVIAVCVIWFTPGPSQLEQRGTAGAGKRATSYTPTNTQNSPPSITRMMTMGQVLEIWGPPDTSDETAWSYGLSSIEFDQGRVINWQDEAGRFGAGATAEQQQARVTVGASKTEVLELHGAPLMASDTIWTYRVSQIYFVDGETVSGWRSSPLDPLPVEKANWGDKPD